MTKPIIGITPSVGDMGERGRIFRMEVSYVEAVEAAGGVPILLPPSKADMADLLRIVDGVVFSGGGDIRPDRYGDTTVHETTYGVDDQRDEFELALLEAALAADVPTLAICRGIQVLNVALGGTLHQDVSLDDNHSAEEHRQPWELGSWENAKHTVTVEPDSLAAKTLGKTTVQVNSAHHQTLKDVAPGLRITGRAHDGTVEMVEAPGKQFVLGVQWHPEKMFPQHADHANLFAQLVQEATAYKAAKALAV